MSKLDERFEEFELANPRVYSELVRLARQLLERGHQKIGIGMLFEVMRWQSMLRTYGDAYKMNNSYRSRYARKMIEEYPEFEGRFEIRELKS